MKSCLSPLGGIRRFCVTEGGSPVSALSALLIRASLAGGNVEFARLGRGEKVAPPLGGHDTRSNSAKPAQARMRWRSRFSPRATTSIIGTASAQAFPQPLQIRRTERAVVETVTGPTLFAPDHAPVIGTHRAIEPALAQSAQHLSHIDVAELSRMRRFVELMRPRAFPLSRLPEVHPSSITQPPPPCPHLLPRI